jgi:hypothetical protein
MPAPTGEVLQITVSVLPKKIMMLKVPDTTLEPFTQTQE